MGLISVEKWVPDGLHKGPMSFSSKAMWLVWITGTFIFFYVLWNQILGNWYYAMYMICQHNDVEIRDNSRLKQICPNSFLKVSVVVVCCTKIKWKLNSSLLFTKKIISNVCCMVWFCKDTSMFVT